MSKFILPNRYDIDRPYKDFNLANIKKLSKKFPQRLQRGVNWCVHKNVLYLTRNFFDMPGSDALLHAASSDEKTQALLKFSELWCTIFGYWQYVPDVTNTEQVYVLGSKCKYLVTPKYDCRVRFLKNYSSYIIDAHYADLVLGVSEELLVGVEVLAEQQELNDYQRMHFILQGLVYANRE